MPLIRNVLVMTALLLPVVALAAGGASQRGNKKAKQPAKPKTSHVQPAPAKDASMRFNMTQNGKHMSADEFDAWMKSRGVRVAKGAVKPAASDAEAKTANDG